MIVLGIETSCDETACAVVENGRIISDSVSSQINIHSKYGGVVPELASREHLKKINLLLKEVLSQASLNYSDIDAIAVTAHPGLEGSLLVGLMTARTLSYLTGKPLIEIDHLEAHLFASRFISQKNPPGLGLIVSGGHTRIIHIQKWGDYEVLGNTRDDAAGECFDKVASILSLGYPGGPAISQAALEGNRKRFSFPVSRLEGYDFSYSGLKTAVLYKVKYDIGKDSLTGKTVRDVAASFQEAALTPLVENTLRAAEDYKAEWVFCGGGVAASCRLREMFNEKKGGGKTEIIFPPPRLCTDNAAMIAACGEFHLGVRA